jgi:hypothetical protein
LGFILQLYKYKLSSNPQGYRGWPWPHIFVYKGKLLVQYWGKVNDWEGNYVIMHDGQTWSEPKELKADPGTLVVGKDSLYHLYWSGQEGLKHETS